MVDHHRLWRMFYHEERWADAMSGVVALDHVIDIETPHLEGSGITQNDLYNTFLFDLRRALGVSLPPLPASLGGSGIADEINPGVTSATAGSSKASPQKKKTWQPVDKKPAGDVVSATAAPIPRGSVAGMASATAAPAAAAVSVRPCGCTDVRLKQASAPARPATSSGMKGKGKGRGHPAAVRRGLRRQLGRLVAERLGTKLGTDTRKSARSSLPTTAPSSTTMYTTMSARTPPTAGHTTARAWTGSTLRTWSSPSASAFATALACRCRQRGFATSLT